MPIRSVLIGLIFSLWASHSQAVWFEATGQAAIEGNNRQLARQHATEEAIKQALLFAGASVRSVQQMADGLLKEDQFEVRAAGEVHALELIDEIYTADYVTVSIRADIFPQETQCAASAYRKSLVTSWFPKLLPHQAPMGELHDLGQVLPTLIQNEIVSQSDRLALPAIVDYYIDPSVGQSVQSLTALAQRHNAQYVLTGQIEELSTSPAPSTGLAFWQDSYPTRHLGFKIQVFDGHTGEQLFEKRYQTSQLWTFDRHQPVDASSQRLWMSKFGEAVLAQVEKSVQDLDEALGCVPAYGRVLQVSNQALTINIGSTVGVKRGDQLVLVQQNQFKDQEGTLHIGYRLHPTRVRVTQVSPHSAVVEAVDGSFLANIQPNDFVSRY